MKKRLLFVAILYVFYLNAAIKPMKILMVVGTFPVIHDICILNQITGLLDRGHDVRIFAFSKGDCINVQEDVVKYNLVNRTVFKKFPTDVQSYDIILFQFGHRLFDVKKEYKFKGKVAVCLRGYDITVYLKNNPHAYDQYFNACDLFMPVCQSFKKILEHIGCPSHKILIQHSAIDCSRFTFKQRVFPQQGPFNIVSAGRFIEKKGFIYAIRAIAQLIKKYPHIRYTLIGDGVLRGEYEQAIKAFGIEDKVRICTWQAHNDYIKTLEQAHLLIMPSITAANNDQEGIANVLKEAMALGLITIATDHSGNAELIDHGVNGFLVPEHDINGIIRTVEYLCDNPHVWIPIQEAAVRKVHQELDKEKENNKLEKILHGLISQ
jgi:colanic acid/amylovoran biosynthesis glycosyltransferase